MLSLTIWIALLACTGNVLDTDPATEPQDTGNNEACEGPFTCTTCSDLAQAIDNALASGAAAVGNACPNGMSVLWDPGCYVCAWPPSHTYYDADGHAVSIWKYDFDDGFCGSSGLWEGPLVPEADCDVHPVTMPYSCYEEETFVAEDCQFIDMDLVYPSPP